MEELGVACQHLATRLSQMKHMHRQPSSLLGLHQAKAVFEVANGQDEEEQNCKHRHLAAGKRWSSLGFYRYVL